MKNIRETQIIEIMNGVKATREEAEYILNYCEEDLFLECLWDKYVICLSEDYKTITIKNIKEATCY